MIHGSENFNLVIFTGHVMFQRYFCPDKISHVVEHVESAGGKMYAIFTPPVTQPYILNHVQLSALVAWEVLNLKDPLPD